MTNEERAVTAEDIAEAKGCNILGPQYFAARRIASEVMAKFEAEQFKPLIDKLRDHVADSLWSMVEDSLLSDVEMNLQGTMWRQIDGSVEALLSGERWALEKYALADRYDLAAVRASVARYVPEELQNKRIAELEAELAKVTESLARERSMRR